MLLNIWEFAESISNSIIEFILNIGSLILYGISEFFGYIIGLFFDSLPAVIADFLKTGLTLMLTGCLIMFLLYLIPRIPQLLVLVGSVVIVGVLLYFALTAVKFMLTVTILIGMSAFAYYATKLVYLKMREFFVKRKLVSREDVLARTEIEKLSYRNVLANPLKSDSSKI